MSHGTKLQMSSNAPTCHAAVNKLMTYRNLSSSTFIATTKAKHGQKPERQSGQNSRKRSLAPDFDILQSPLEHKTFAKKTFSFRIIPYQLATDGTLLMVYASLCATHNPLFHHPWNFQHIQSLYKRRLAMKTV